MKSAKRRCWIPAAMAFALGAGCLFMSSTPSSASTSDPNITIGIAAITNTSASVTSLIAAVQSEASMLGWHTTALNADGDASQMAEDMSTLVTDHVNGIVDIGINPAQAHAGMQAAKAAGIPIIAVGAVLINPGDLVATTYTADDKRMSQMLADQILKDYKGKSAGNAVDLQDSSLGGSVVIRSNSLTEILGKHGIKAVSNPQVNLANAVQSTDQALSDAVQANPSIKMAWGILDFEFAAAIQTIQTDHLGNIGVFGYLLDPIDFGLLRADKNGPLPEAVVDSPYSAYSWYAMNDFVNKFDLHKTDWVASEAVHPAPYIVLTPQNVPATGDTYNYPSFEPSFVKLWTSEGVKVSNG